MQKIRIIYTAISEKTVLLTNQPIVANNINFIGLADFGPKNVKLDLVQCVMIT